MIKKIIFVLFFVFAFGITVNAEDLGLSAESAVLMCADTGEVVYSENPHKQLSMASTTKIMTSLLALEKGNLSDVIVVKEDMVKVEGTSMGLLPGDKVTLEGLVYGMLLQSGNDAANVTAVTIGKTAENFAKMMNDRASEIGMKNTNFVTPSGLDDENHYSTAYDMALLGCTAIKNADFRKICSLKSARISYGNPPYMRTLTNHNRLLSYYEYAIGIKTGFTKKSGRCLVSAAEKDGVLLVAVTLGDPNDWQDHKTMFNYGFERVENKSLEKHGSIISVDVLCGEKNNVNIHYESEPMLATLATAEEIQCEILYNKQVFAPVKKGDKIGEAVYYFEDKEVLRVPLVSESFVNEKKFEEKKQQGFLEKIKLWFYDLLN